MNDAVSPAVPPASSLLSSPSSAGLVEQALADVARHDFYQDIDDTLAGVVGRSMPSENALRQLIAELELQPGARVLQIGTGTGYAAAVLSRVAAEVFTIESMREIAELARSRFDALGYANITVVEGNGFHGMPEQAPFDAILVLVRGESSLAALEDQLRIGGVLVGTRGKDWHHQTLYTLKRINVESFSTQTGGEFSVAADVGEIMVAFDSGNEHLVVQARRNAESNGTELEDEIRQLVGQDETDFYRALAFDRGMRFADADALVSEIDVKVFGRISRTFLSHNRLVPVREKEGVFHFATSDPDASALEIRKAVRSRRVQLRLVTPTDLRRLRTVFELALYDQSAVPEPTTSGFEERDLSRKDDETLEAHYIALFDAMLSDAIEKRASDLHLERYGGRVVVRLRVDGDLRELEGYRLTPEDLARLVNVIKVRANLDISERRLPQGGRTSLVSDGRKYDLRIQTQPCLHGEHAVIRLLPQESRLLSIEELGFPEEVARHYRRLLAHPAGLVLVVGPTGSGKSTTLYAGLGELAADRRRKVITVEDPIEYAIDGVQQTQVRPEAGFHFADAMRAFVREDPDVILVGEIRDSETALEAIRAAQTGHLVLSTLHCNDAVDAVQRLFDLGMHPNSIASELLAIAAQRLAKRLCERCRVAATAEPEIAAEVFPGGVPEGFRCFSSTGCNYCGGDGTRGRVAVVEFLRVTSRVRSAIARQLPLDDLRATALEAGLISMRESALHHVNAGTISFSELPRILPAERLRPD